MHLLGKETAANIINILLSDYYQKWLNNFQEILTASRDPKYRKDPKMILALQVKISEIESTLWEKIREGKELAKELETEDNSSEEEVNKLKGIKKHIFLHKQLIRILHSIVDGIAWRNLNYDRMYLSSSSRGLSTGAIDISKPDFQGEIKWANFLTNEYKSITILNDLTHFLKVGDVTEIAPDGLSFIHEVKKNGKRIQNIFSMQNKPGKISQQESRLLELQKIALKKEIKTPDGVVKLTPLNISLKTHLKRVGDLIEKSATDTLIEEKLEPFLAVHIFKIKDITKENVELLTKKRKSMFNKKHLVLPFSNWDSFYEEKGTFFRANLPYSVFPFSNQVCIDLMAGNILLKGLLDITALKKYLEKHGWEVNLFTEDELDNQLKEFKKYEDEIFQTNKSLYEITPEETPILTIRRGPFRFPITLTIYSRIINEFMTGETLLEALESVYRNAAKKQKTQMIFPYFKDEEKTWN